MAFSNQFGLPVLTYDPTKPILRWTRVYISIRLSLAAHGVLGEKCRKPRGPSLV